ncbi:MAG: HEPN domain-containing protein [Nitrososphaerota archaeon]
MSIRDEVVNWLESAEADLKHARKSLEINDHNWACFAAQQAAEKALEALIMHVVGEYPRGHDLVKLYRMVKGYAEVKVDESKLARLSSYYTQARYPNAGIERPHEELSEELAIEAIEVAEVVMREVAKIIRSP